MEAALRKRPLPSYDDDSSSSYQHLATLEAILQRLLQLEQPIVTETTTDTLTWLQDLLFSGENGNPHDHQTLLLKIHKASLLNTEAQQQQALFDILPNSMDLLFQIVPRLPDIAKLPIIHDDTDPSTALLQEQEKLRQQAEDAQQLAILAQQEWEALQHNNSSTSTHSVHSRKLLQQAQKQMKVAQQNAKKANERAIQAGAILKEEKGVVFETSSALTNHGMLHYTSDQMDTLQETLLPEGSRQYYDTAHQRLPLNSQWEEGNGYDKVTIPPPVQSTTSSLRRIPMQEALADNPMAQRVFSQQPNMSLNPMQSQVYDIAYHKRDNMLVCAPTGAGKTNVALLTVLAHFRDVGLLSNDDNTSTMDTGKKVVYIAPMKALAQEVVEKFSLKLKTIRLVVKELTGDMQLTKAEAEAAHVLVTTPEKWDVVTRKAGTDENSLGNQCGLLIMDEIHLLADERGAVLESLVARLHRLVESRQRQVRLVGLSATLPNYQDVASFLQVPDRAVFYFGPEYRPVPLQQQFYGITVNSRDRRLIERKLNEICYDVVVDALQRGYQVMVFVHSRKGTGDTATALTDLAREAGELESLFVTQGKDSLNGEAHKKYAERARKSRNREVSLHFENGIGIHHAGMLRGDRKLTEQMFADGAIKVLVCTATLAWGVNLPAHSVVIKGTDVYNPEKGGTVDLSILDVQQIFGRAGRPQFDSSGEATLITTHDSFKRYLDKLVRAVPIESNFTKQLADHLNAEIVGGTVTNIQEAASWLTYTYLYTRMLRNPLAYGINADQKADDPMLRSVCKDLVMKSAAFLDQNQMIRYDPKSGNLAVVNRGRVAAHFYVQTESMSSFREMMQFMPSPTDSDLCRVICSANEFQQLKIRQEEMEELQRLVGETCPMKIKGAGMDDAGRGLVTDATDKAFVLMQAYISRYRITSFTLISDTNYIASNISRVARAIFEICLADKNASSAAKLLRIAKSTDKRIWWFQTPLRVFEDELRASVYTSIENNSYDAIESLLQLLEMQPGEVGQLCRWNKGGGKVQRFIKYLPMVSVQCDVQPISSGVIKFHIVIKPSFNWNAQWHGGAQSFWLWIEDADQNRIHHHESFIFTKRTFPEPKIVDASLPAFDPMPKQYFIRVFSDSWVGVEVLQPVPFENIKFPKQKTPYTDLQDLTPLPISVLQNPSYEKLYEKIETFNPIQTQLFHVLYHTDTPVLLGAPTGSGKTLIAEIALLRMKRKHANGICVYIAPLKSLARERLKEWKRRLGAKPLQWTVLELSGDTHHDQHILEEADVLVCTPEKWDLISRGWNGNNARSFVKRVKLLVLDEVHLLGEDRGAVLEAIVSRTRYISQFTGLDQSQGDATRIMGLSTALANPTDLADWIGIDTEGLGHLRLRGLYNFRNSVRPVPLKIHIQGYPGKHYCPRMASMNKPAFAALKQHSPNKPALIFVSSRRQTRLTAFDIISYASADEDPKRFLNCDESYMESVAERITDEALKHTLLFGIGLHHAGLSSYDRDVVERMFLNGDIQVLVATATLAWGVNLPAHLVIVKGTEYFDGKLSTYVDYPLTDVLQMMGRAGRPGFDTEGTAVIMASEEKKDFYKKFLFSPFPVESCLQDRLCENLNAEIASGTISSIVDAVGYLSWTFLARRVKANPSYYGAKSSDEEDVQSFLLELVKQKLHELEESGCIIYEKDNLTAEVRTTPLGIAASNYYLVHRTPKQMQFGVHEARKLIESKLQEAPKAKPFVIGNMISSGGQKIRASSFEVPGEVDEISNAWIFYSLSCTHEFDELPVRHNEEHLNARLSEEVAWGADTKGLTSGNWDHHINPEVFENPHTKCFLLLQAYIEHTRLPISDYVNDTNTVVDSIPRLLGAMEYIAQHEISTNGSLNLLSQICRTRQLFSTRLLAYDDPLVQLSGITEDFAKKLREGGKDKSDAVRTIYELRSLPRHSAVGILHRVSKGKVRLSCNVDRTIDDLYNIPFVKVTSVEVVQQMDKRSGDNVGSVKIVLEVEKSIKSGRKEESSSLTILLGTFQHSKYLGKASLRLSRPGKWSATKSIEFDWNEANAEGGPDGGRLIVRLHYDQVRGFDQELEVGLKC